MSELKDYYDILDVSEDASLDEIKSSYRKLAKKYHPDICRDENAEEKTKEINEAYDILKDDTKRADYDNFGSDHDNQMYNSNPQNTSFKNCDDCRNLSTGKRCKKHMKKYNKSKKGATFFFTFIIFTMILIWIR